MGRVPLSLMILLGAALLATVAIMAGAAAGLGAGVMSAIALSVIGVGALASGSLLIADVNGARADFEHWTSRRRSALRMSARAAGAYQVIMGVLLILYVAALLTTLA